MRIGYDGNVGSSGGGIGIRQRYDDGGGGPVSIIDCEISGNKSGSGGGIFVGKTQRVTISGCSITGNEATGDGGGIDNQYSPYSASKLTVTLQNCTITGNAAGRGGGIFGGSVSIEASSISNNSAVAGTPMYYSNPNGNGGGIYASTVTATNCTISGNSASGNGGGIYATGGAKLQNTTITQNRARLGGGVFIATGTLTASNTILAGNSASALGPDISGYLGATLDLHYSLVGNASGSGLAEAPLGSQDANGNLIGGPIHGVIDPLLGPLADNGGFTLPDGSHILTMALLPGSPAINAGDLDAIAGENGVPVSDQRGAPFTRVYFGRIDIGAVEYQTPGVLAGDYNHNRIVDAADYTVWRNWLGTTIYDVVAGLPGDGNEDGVVNQADYDLWRANFGATLTAGGTANVATNTSSSANVRSSGSMRLEAVTAPAENSDSLQAVRQDPIALSAPPAVSSHDDNLLAWLAAQTARPSHKDVGAEFNAGHDLPTGDAHDSAFATIDDAFAGLNANGLGSL
jgi:parallel beta-helix repeat protein